MTKDGRKIGNPYQVAGVWYYPKDDPSYDETGYASWYGTEFHGKKTANGEVFDMNTLSAAHKTLPLPSYVKVTNLENNRTMVIRVNDRGPFVSGRIIDISRRGAQLLGFHAQGLTKVRVQVSDEYGNPLSAGRALSEGPREAAPAQVASNDVLVEESLDAPAGEPLPVAPVAAPPVRTSAPVVASSASGGHYVQIGAFSDRSGAEAQARKLESIGEQAEIEPVESGGRRLWRVRIGPFSLKNVADSVLSKVVSNGFFDARVMSR
ncbi:septal ring lytic transglycosylase RlpA family protein [Gimibacter soli]|uniref:Endolytic peptidoglycan transglycosylase RlpA n=1 Tax=Gimibacter soli TaxID=3024400 RepID=A0AAE9XUC4_9PROT|nr:septal ring lytic transglycosylase RlpA family protein [Gimibacter soli]WCL52869.1 septal ring lytic transglycosylase RlpA family protein [Gimibacter soli]